MTISYPNRTNLSAHRVAPTRTVYAKYIGRVGALAVALGVTGAMTVSPGVAWADDTASSAGSSDTPSSSDSGSTSGTTQTSPSTGTQTPSTGTASGSTDAPTDGTTTTTSSGTSGGTDTATQIGSEQETTLNGGVVIRSSGASPAATGTGDEDADETQAETTDVEGSDEQPVTDEDVEESSVPEETDEQPATDEDVEESSVPEESGGGGPAAAEETRDGGADSTPGTTDPLTPPTTTSPDTTDNTAATANKPGADVADDSDEEDTATAANLSTQSAGDASTAALPNATATTPATVSTNPIASFFANLPTPTEVVHQIQTAVTGCACAIINGALNLVNSLSSMVSTVPTAPGDPAEAPIAWTVLAWVRRQADYAVQAFNRSPLGQFVHGVTTQITQAITDFGNSPFGRETSARIVQFIEECNGSTSLPDDLERTVVIGGLTEPTDFDYLTDEHNPNEIHRILITEKSGAVKVYDPQTGTVTTLVNLPTVTADGERGLVGIEVDPQFWTEGAEGEHAIYVAYTGADNLDRLSKLTLSEGLDEVLSETELLRSTELGNNFHHGGEIEFDPQGQYLYWAVGDNTESANAQDLTNIHGKILRLNRDGSAPEDNPFYNTPDAVKQIYAYGLRNPFRFTFTPDGHLLAGDVGQASWEELNLITAGGNYGWPGEEGPCSGTCDTINPLYAYTHSAPPANVGSITSVVFYTGTTLPEEYRNKVYIADYSVGWLKELTFDDEFTSLISERTIDSQAGTTVKLSQGPDGNIYQLNIYPGQLSVIAPSAGNRAPTAVIGASSTSGAGDSLTVDFTSVESSDPDGDNLTYQWNFGNGQTSTQANPTGLVFTNTDEYTAYTVTLTVNDGEATSTTTQRIVVGSTPPTAEISVNDETYNAGDTISFSAVGLDDQDGALPASAYKWTVVFHHADHVHPFQDNIIGSAGSITIPRTPDQLVNTYYRISLTVTDSSGLTTTTHKDVNPNVVTLTFGSNNPDATYTIDGQPHKGTYTEQAVVGVQRVLNAPSPQHVAGEELVFVSWSDGGGQSHIITTPGTNTNYTVTYDPAPALV